MQETTTTPLVVSQLDEGKNNKSATCLTNHDRKSYTDKSTQTSVPSDKCLSPLEYESMTETQHNQCSESSIVSCSQMPIPFDKYSTSLGYESMTGKHQCLETSTVSCGQVPSPLDEYLSLFEYKLMTGKPYQCSESSTEENDGNHTSVDLCYPAIPRKSGPGFLVYGCEGAGKTPEVYNADHTTNDITVISQAATLQHTCKTKHDKSANCLTNERSNPKDPLDQSTQISVAYSDGRLSRVESESTPAIAKQCTEGSSNKSYKLGYRLVKASSKITIPEEIDYTLPASSPESSFWPISERIKKQPVDYEDKMLLSPILRPFLSKAGEN